MYRIILSRQAAKDAKKLAAAKLADKTKRLLAILQDDPFQTPPPYEKLKGDLSRFYSRRINVQHRLVYEVLEEQKMIHVLRMWTHYE